MVPLSTRDTVRCPGDPCWPERRRPVRAVGGRDAVPSPAETGQSSPLLSDTGTGMGTAQRWFCLHAGLPRHGNAVRTICLPSEHLKHVEWKRTETEGLRVRITGVFRRILVPVPGIARTRRKERTKGLAAERHSSSVASFACLRGPARRQQGTCSRGPGSRPRPITSPHSQKDAALRDACAGDDAQAGTCDPGLSGKPLKSSETEPLFHGEGEAGGDREVL